MPRRYFLIILILIISASRFSYAANIDTSFSFSTIETEHFSIHFHQGLEELAQKAAAIAENVHQPLVEEFNWAPQEKTQVVLIDDTDFTNGSATVLPYNTIYIQVVPPSIDMTIGEYDDWLRMLIVHEYSHILTMDAARGYSRVMRATFGKPLPGYDPFSFLMFIAAAPPNIFLPSWWQEGMATWGETEYTGRGRGRSTFYEMILRMAVAENNIPTVGQINGDVPYWPDGHLPYIFGLRFQKYIADRYGKEAIGRLNMAHAGRFPYFINGAALQFFGREYATLYREMVEDLRREEGNRVGILKQLPFTSLDIFDMEGESLTNPRYSHDGELIAFNRRDPHRHEAIVITGRDGKGAKEVVRRLPADRSICWSPDDSRLYFSQAEVNKGFNIYQDLYSYDLKSGRLKRLTHGLRIKEPDIAPDGRLFAVIASDKGSQNLAILESEGDSYKMRLLTNYESLHVSAPRWSPDGGKIVYSVKDNNGKSGIHIYDTLEKTDRLLFENDNNNTYPTWSPDSRNIIYTSDKTKVFNLFAYSIEDGRNYQVTHLLGGVFQADVSPDGREIVFSSYDSRGFKIGSVGYTSENWMTTPGPAIEPYWREDVSAIKDTDFDSIIRNRQSEIKNEPKPYSAAKTLLPSFWLPTLSGDHQGTVAGAFTAGQDVLSYNTYLAQISYGTSSGKRYYDITYLNDYAYPTFILQTYARPVLYSGLIPGDGYFELNKSLILSMSAPLDYIESTYRFTLGYQVQEQEELGRVNNNTLSKVNVFEGRRDNVSAGVEFSNSLKYPYSISHEEGRKINLMYRHYSRETGSDLNSRELIVAYAEHYLIPSDYFKHHVLYLSLTGAASAGDRTVQQAFQLGGYPQQSPYPLRGYPSRFATGQYIATGTLEYRAPVRYIFKGSGTKPFFYEKLHGAVFSDVGEVWDEEFSIDKMKVGAGIEARLDMTLGYRLIKITPTLGLAHGFNKDGETIVYFTIYTDL